MAPRVTEDKYSETHEKILRAAEILFSQGGYNGTSMNDIVKESGMSKGAIYSHFENKESLFLELLSKQTETGLNLMKSMFSPKDTAMQKLEKVIQAQFNSTCEVTEEDCRKQVELLVTASRMDSLKKRIAKQYEEIQQFGAEIYNEGAKNGEFRKNIDVNSIVSIIIGAMNGLNFMWLATGTTFDAEKIKNTFISVIREGILIKNRNKE